MIKQSRTVSRGHVQVRKAQSLIMEAYVAVLLCIFPFYNTDTYFNILADRAVFFINATVVMTAALVVEFVLWNIWAASRIGGDKRGPGKITEIKIPMEYIFLAAFLLISAVSAAASGYWEEAWSGSEGRLQGLSMWLTYGTSFYCMARYFRPEKKHLYLFLCAGAVAAVWGICDYMGPGFSWWLKEVKKGDRGSFTSSIGNINTYTAYMMLCYGLTAAYAVFAQGLSRLEKAGLGAAMILFPSALITGRSDNAVLGAVVLCLMIPLSIRDSGQLTRYICVLASWAAALWIVGIMSLYMDNPYLSGSEGLLLRVSSSRAAPVLAAVMAAAVVAACILLRKDWNLPGWFRKAWAACLAAACVVFVLILADVNFHAEPGKYGAAEAYLRFGDTWGSNRGFCWKLAGKTYAGFTPFKKLIGSGPETFGIIMKREHFREMAETCGVVFDSPHNEFIQYVFCTGILGAIAYYAFLAVCAVKGLRGGAIGKAAAAAVLAYTAVSVVNISVPITQPFVILLAAWCSNLSLYEGGTR